jgi:hypothetical protein
MPATLPIDQEQENIESKAGHEQPGYGSNPGNWL